MDLTAGMRMDKGAKERDINRHGVRKAFEKELPILLHHKNSESNR